MVVENRSNDLIHVVVLSSFGYIYFFHVFNFEFFRMLNTHTLSIFFFCSKSSFRFCALFLLWGCGDLKNYFLMIDENFTHTHTHTHIYRNLKNHSSPRVVW
ncbi:unnamed protein product [Cuscuta europaea]|uniref:Uncharacterized protein n=1 Tax=Cuscuta europaea TaxID=41803 RepID=A0A9P1E3R3_CUSEU|nr:unnamed protein product [Cuscuta europaea]